MRIRFFRRRPPLRDKKRGRPLIAFDEKTGKKVKRALIIAGAALVVLIAALLLRPEPMLMASAEVTSVWERGALRVAVLTDVPGMSSGGEGLERDISAALAKRIMEADDAYSYDNLPIEYVEVTEMTVGAKLYDGSVDVAVSMMPRGANSSYSYSGAYFTDPVEIVAIGGAPAEITKDTKIACIQSASSDNLYVPSGMVYNRLSSYITAREEEGYTTDNIIKCASYEDLIRILATDAADCAALSGVLIEKYKDAGFVKAGIVIGKIDYSVACSSASPALASIADMVIGDMRASGELEALYAKYHLTPYIDEN